MASSQFDLSLSELGSSVASSLIFEAFVSKKTYILSNSNRKSYNILII